VLSSACQPSKVLRRFKAKYTECLLDTIEHSNPHCNVVVNLLDLRFNDDTGVYELKAKWRGFDDEEPTWEPFSNMQEDIPDMLPKFLRTFHNQDLVNDALSVSS